MEDKIKRLMEHANIDEKTAKDALEKNNDNVLEAYAYLQDIKEEKETPRKDIKKDKKYVDYNSNQRYMNTNPKRISKKGKEESESTVKPVKPVKVEKPEKEEVKKSYDAPKAPHVNLKHEDFNIGAYNTSYSDKGSYYAQQEYPHNIDAERYKEYTDSNFKGIIKQILGWIVGLFEYLVKTKLVIMRRNNVIINIPLIISIIILLFIFWAALPVFIVSLFFGFRYFIESEDNVDGNLEDYIQSNYRYDNGPNRMPPFHKNNGNNVYPPRGNRRNVQNAPYQNYPHNQNRAQENYNTQNHNINQPYNNVDFEKQKYEDTNKKYFEEIQKFQGMKNIILTQDEPKNKEEIEENNNNNNENDKNNE